ncbi:zincin [Agrocybe pediades]|nr:zincin [Agrocybe pediades]
MLSTHSRFALAALVFVSQLFALVDSAPLTREMVSRERQVGPHAQCLTDITLQDREELEQGILQMRSLEGVELNERDLLGSDRETFLFNVSFNVVFVNETREGGWIGDSDIKAQIQVLNNDYNATGIQFRLVKTTRIKSKDWFENVYPGSPQEQAMKLLYNIGDASTLNVYTLTFNSTTASLGTASIPSAYYRNPKSDGVMIRHSTVTNGPRTNYDMGRTLTHEVGHWLGLFHTFEGGCDDGVGDNIADTPPQASGSDGCPKGRDSCPGDGPDLINNFMDYSYDSCMDSFTKGQAVRMRESAKAFRRPGGKVAPPEKKASTTSVSVSATTVTVTATVSVTASSTTTAVSGTASSTVASSVTSTSTSTSLSNSTSPAHASSTSTTSAASTSTTSTSSAVASSVIPSSSPSVKPSAY